MINTPLNSIHPRTRAEAVWRISHKKGTGKPRFEYDEAVEEALCFGWIDGKPNTLDDERSMLKKPLA